MSSIIQGHRLFTGNSVDLRGHARITEGATVRMFEKMTSATRIELAQAKMERVLDHFLYLLELHANNEFVVYSPVLSAQIRESFAANAFNVFQRSMHQIEIVRLCALWDKARPDKENIPTVVELIDDEKIIEELAQETRAHWANNQPPGLMNPSPDPGLAAIQQQDLMADNARFGDELPRKARAELKKTIVNTRASLSSPLHESVMNMRDKHLAHSLEETGREKKRAVPAMRYGDETVLLNDSIPIIKALLCWVNGNPLLISESQKIARENAQALWLGCKIDVLC
jgi:hypothetical protein